MVEYTHRLNKGLCNALFRLYQAGGVAKISDLSLSKSEYCNFQKLKYWRFVEKVPTDDEDKGGKWQITYWGKAFVEGDFAYEHVVTYRGAFVRFESSPIVMETVIGKYDYKPWYAKNANAIKMQSEMFSGAANG
ncbi:MAG: hypothetical protein R3361_08515 [Aequorivita vladivostokensis]|nr:hypothetical protein [Aequorivita vladivostokensis]